MAALIYLADIKYPRKIINVTARLTWVITLTVLRNLLGRIRNGECNYLECVNLVTAWADRMYMAEKHLMDDVKYNKQILSIRSVMSVYSSEWEKIIKQHRFRWRCFCNIFMITFTQSYTIAIIASWIRLELLLLEPITNLYWWHTFQKM